MRYTTKHNFTIAGIAFTTIAFFLLLNLSSTKKSNMDELWNETNISNILRDLDLSDPKNTKIAQEFSLDDLVFVSTWSSNHHDEARYLCHSLRQYAELRNRHWHLVVFHLGGVSQRQQHAYRSCCPQANFQEFPFWRYPSFVADLNSYRFKPLVVAEAMLEAKAIIFLDASIQFLENEKSLQEIIEFAAYNANMLKMVFFGQSSHSIYAATDPLMYKFLPLPEKKAKHLDMFESGYMLWLGTLETKRDLLRPWVECALIKDCMAPPGAKHDCHFQEDDRFTVYADCHRYDQSAINLIAASVAGGQSSRYSISGSPMLPRRQHLAWLRSWIDAEFRFC